MADLEQVKNSESVLGDRLKYLNKTLDAIDEREGIKRRGSLIGSIKTKLFPKRETLSKESLLFVSEAIKKTKAEISKAIIGQEEIVQQLLCSIVANGHTLIEANPGVAKTLLVRTVAAASGCSFSRIQFTVDLLPTDITGVTTYDKPSESFKTIKGPIFANFVLTDEINRAPPKTQSALLEAMQEKQVTIGDKTYKIEKPFFVMATQNPVETTGVYKLPEAQLDRFLFKLFMDYPSHTDEKKILFQNMTLHDFDSFGIVSALSSEIILKMQDMAQKVFVGEDIQDYIVKIIHATRNPKKFGIKLGKYIEYGASPRASIGLFIAAKATALLNGEGSVHSKHIKEIAHSVMRHRIHLNYEAQADEVTTDDVIKEIISEIPAP